MEKTSRYWRRQRRRIFWGGPLVPTVSKLEEKTPADPVAELRRQTEAVNIELMDNMEASVLQNGEFFRKLGDKPTLTKKYVLDTRALIFNSRVQEKGRPPVVEDREAHAVITRKGQRKLVVNRDEWKKIISMGSDEEKRSKFAASGDKIAGREGIVGNDQLIIELGTEIKICNLKEIDNDSVNSAISASIGVARETSRTAQDKKNLEAEQRKLVEARELSKLFNTLTQPPAGETSSPAGPPPSPSSPAV